MITSMQFIHINKQQEKEGEEEYWQKETDSNKELFPTTQDNREERERVV